MRADDFHFRIGPVRTEVACTQQIPILHVCDLGESKTKGITSDENLSQVCSNEESKPESVIVNESSTE